MSTTQFVEYRGHGFWAYDVAMGIFLKYVIDAAEEQLAITPEEWLREAVSRWRIVACVSDYSVSIESHWSATQVSTFIRLAERACAQLEQREAIPESETGGWSFVDDLRLHTRGAEEVQTAPVVELGRAVVSLVRGSLPEAPAGFQWIYGTPKGRILHPPPERVRGGRTRR